MTKIYVKGSYINMFVFLSNMFSSMSDTVTSPVCNTVQHSGVS